MPAQAAGPAAPADAEASTSWSFGIFCVYTFILVGRPQDYLEWMMPLRPALLFTVLAAAATLFRTHKGAVNPFQLRETKLYLFLFAVMCASIPLAVYRRGSFEFVVTQYVSIVAFYVLFVSNVDTLHKFKRIVLVLAMASFMFSAFGLARGGFVDGRFYVGSPMYDTNDAAFVEVSLLGFVLAVALGPFAALPRILAVVAAALGALLTLYTGSRGGLIGLAVFLFLFLMLKVPHVGKSLKVIVCLGLFAAAIANIERINVERYGTLSSIESDYNFEEFGRIDVWTRGLQLFASNPLTGVGVACFGAAIGMMRDAEGRVPYWQAAHSSYIQVIAETGIFGAMAFVWLIIGVLATFARLRKRAGEPALRELGLFPVTLLTGFAALLVSATFLTQAYSVFFPLYFATAASLRVIASRMTSPSVIAASAAHGR